MTTHNTGNPLGSSDPRDLYDNAENLDQAINKKGNSWRDRFGVLRPSLAGAVDPTGAIQEAMDAVFNAISVSSDSIYSTATEGLAGTSDGDVFWVYPNDDNDLENLVLYKNDGGAAIELYEQFNLNAFMIEEGSIKPSHLGD